MSQSGGSAYCRFTSTSPGSDTPTTKIMLQRQIDATDLQIDRPVYELYDLTEEEAAPGVPYAIIQEAAR